MTDNREFADLFQVEVGRPPERGTSLKGLSSLKIGGPADLFFEARTEEELKTAVALAVRESHPFFVFGGGYNVLFDDAGFRGLLIRNRAEGISHSEEKGVVEVSSGTGLPVLLQTALERGWAGLEFLAGIPGSVGGAVFSNAGAFGGSIGEIVVKGALLDRTGGEKPVSHEDFGFGYRRSSLQESHGVVLRIAVMASPGDSKEALAKVRDFMEKRKAKHPPWGTACAGSYFKNPCSPSGERTAAGFLLEKAGARGMRVGDAAVYEKHCNFFVNLGEATSADVLRLADELKERVFRMFGVRLEEEVIHLPATASML
jgi:UDP-N-acetylmuramate dehydrogenase